MARAPKKPGSSELNERARAVKLFVFDVDGVLTDGGLFYGPEGEAMKRFDVKDGHGLVLARLCGLRAAILTARTSKMVEVRGKELKLAAVMQGRKDKAAGLAELCEQLSVTPEECAYMGDDVNDLAPMALVGLPSCPADAASEARQAALFVAQRPGGHGAARELIELVMKAQGKWDQALALMTHPPA